MNRDRDNWAPFIEAPVKWQEEIDRSGEGLNLRGSARFWETVKSYGLDIYYRDGAPELTTLIIRLAPGLGLELKADPWAFEPDEPEFQGAWIRFRFVPLKECE